ncbi:MAG: HEAT repeat domain-containing protein [Proteobacteria bacterium]|nr:HEAT repeat domain-containing protein [Pseudomonadota bacterium]
MSHPIVERLRSHDPHERAAACMDSQQDPSAALLVEHLGQALGDPVKSVARAASDALANLGPTVPEVSDVVRDALHSQNPQQRWTAAFTSARLAPPGLGLIPALVEAMSSGDGDIRWAAAKLLVETGRLHPEVLGVALGLVRGAENAAVRRMAVFCLRELAPDRPEAATLLIEARSDPDPHVGRAALTVMASLLEPPRSTYDCLLEVLVDARDGATQRLAAVALGELLARHGPEAAPEAEGQLAHILEATGDPDLRRATERALAQIRDAESPETDG